MLEEAVEYVKTLQRQIHVSRKRVICHFTLLSEAWERSI